MGGFYAEYTYGDIGWFPKYVGLFIALVILGSAIGVNRPQSWEVAMVYGILVGLCLYGFNTASRMTIDQQAGFKLLAVEMFWGALSTGIVALIIHGIFD